MPSVRFRRAGAAAASGGPKGSGGAPRVLGEDRPPALRHHQGRRAAWLWPTPHGAQRRGGRLLLQQPLHGSSMEPFRRQEAGERLLLFQCYYMNIIAIIVLLSLLLLFI